MSIQSLKGFTLESCRLSKSSYTFEFCGYHDDVYKTLLVSTSYSFSLLGEKLYDACSEFSLKIWDFLETKLVDVSVEEEKTSSKATFSFENGEAFIVWSDEPLIDNLLIVTNQETGEWFPVS